MTAPVSVPVAVAATPTVADTPLVTTTQGLTTAHPNGGAVPAPIQSQQLFLPIITNVSSLAGAALGNPNGIALLVAVGLVIGGLVYRRTRKVGKD